MRKHSLALSAVVTCGALALCGTAQAGSYTFKTLKRAGQTASYATGVNDRDVVVGNILTNDGGSHGFVWVKGNYTNVHVPHTGGTLFAAINAKGVVAGRYYSRQIGSQVFTYDIATGVETLLPNNDFGFYPAAIGRQGSIVGYAYSNRKNIPSGGFVETPTKTKLLPPLYYATGIDDAGEIVGVDEGVKHYEGFIFSHGKYTYFDAPGASWTAANFVTPAGEVGGIYYDASGTNYYGFTLASGVYTTYAYPNSPGTLVVGLTSRGDVAGSYITDTTSHGFVFVDGTYYTIDPPQSTRTSITGVNANGTLVGEYTIGDQQFGFVAECAPDQRPCTQ